MESLVINGKETHLLKHDLDIIVQIAEVNKDKPIEEFVLLIIALYDAYKQKGPYVA